MRNDKKGQQYRVNEQIRVREVRIVGDGDSMVLPTRQALDMARQQGVDLVEISPNANPPVCRLIDYSKFLYQQKKRAKEMKAKQVKQEVKEIQQGKGLCVLPWTKHPFQGAGRGTAAAFCQRLGRVWQGRADAESGR